MTRTAPAETAPTALQRFRHALSTDDRLAQIQRGLIGDGMVFETPFGPQELLYADYVASGRALRQVEAFVAEEVLPIYANSHTEASYCGQSITRMREEARNIIAQEIGATDDCHVIFSGNGATEGLNRIVALLQFRERVAAGENIQVFIGPYEHHSNILPWRESGATVCEIAEAASGGVDLEALRVALDGAAGADLIVGSFSAASNVTGLLSEPDAVTRLLKRHGALAIWDYACAAPYLEMSMTPSVDAAKDAIVFSAHKFPGGPGASGVLVVRDTIVQSAVPTAPGGGTVSFVSPWTQVYSRHVEDREEAGTPNVIGDIRAALAMLVKSAIGTAYIGARDEALRQRALAAWRDVPGLRLLGQSEETQALPIFSFQINGPEGRVHHQLITRMLSDRFGVQARGGCACAGPYAHRLLGIDQVASGALQARLAAGEELQKPGWTRLNLSYLHTDAQADRIIAAVAEVARTATAASHRYVADPTTARFRASL